MKKQKKQKKQNNKLDIWNYYTEVELAVQRLVLIKKALGIECDELNKEFDWVVETFKDLKSEAEQSCEYLTIKTWEDEYKKQRINFYFDLASK